jgi:hypothetical protein
MQSGEALFEPFAKRLDAFTVNPPSPVIGFDALPRELFPEVGDGMKG